MSFTSPARSFYRAARKYRRLQTRLTQPLDVPTARRLTGKLTHLRKRLTSMNRRWRLGVAASVLSAWLAAPAQGQGTFDLGALNGTNGFTINGVAANDETGGQVSGAGDVNGDGFGDIIIGAKDAGEGGAAYVVFGQAGGFSTTLELSALDGTNGFALVGDADGDEAGEAVGSAGDVNNDGFDDLIVGAPRAGSVGGRAYVVFGKADGFAAEVDLGALDGTDGFALEGGQVNDFVGAGVNGAGDVNNDGFDDVIVGAPGLSTPSNSVTGRAYVVFGKASGFAAVTDLDALDGTDGFRLSGVGENDQAGRAISGVGDVNGDGFDDVLVGAFRSATSGVLAGQAFVVFGQADGFAADISLGALDGTDGFAFNGGIGDLVGVSVSGAGDVNGDDIDDLLIGDADDRSYVVFGSSTSFPASLTANDLDGTNGFRLDGNNYAGFSVSGVGDVNDDGFDDVLIGEPGATFPNTTPGDGYLVFGKASGFPVTLSLLSLEPAEGFRIDADDDNTDFTVGGDIDMNGDGFDDFLVGAEGASPNGTASGQVYVVFGGDNITSLAEAASTGLSLYPNPTQGRATLAAERPLEAGLYDLTGRRLPVSLRPLGEGRYALDLTALPPGFYLLRGTVGGEAFVRRVVRQ